MWYYAMKQAKKSELDTRISELLKESETIRELADKLLN
jgi:hypothetical protein